MKTTLPGDLQAPARARAFVSNYLGTALVPAGVSLDNVLLVVSELVTNAIRAGATSVELNLCIVPPQLDVVVNDDAAGWPTPKTATEDDIGGRGLTIVGQLADTWAVAARPPGKSVRATWFGQGPAT